MIKKIALSFYMSLLISSVCFAEKETPEVVRAATVTKRSFQVTLATVGTLVSKNSVLLQAQTSGVIRRITVTEGSVVKKGDVLVELEDAVLRASFNKAQAAYSVAAAKCHRQKQLLAKKLISPAKFEELQAAMKVAKANMDEAQATLHYATIKSPFGGSIGDVKLSEGAYVKQGDNVLSLVDLNHFKVEFFVPENALNTITKGATIQVTVASCKESHTAVIYAIDPKVNERNHSVRILASLDDTSGTLASGMFCKITLPLSTQTTVLSVPESALRYSQSGAYVYHITKGKVARVDVEILQKDGESVAIKSDLKEGDSIVTQGQEKLFEGTAVTISQ